MAFWLVDVLQGALARGTNKATLVLLNLALFGCILVLSTLLFVPAGLPAELVPHIALLLLLAAGLLASVNWLIAQTGTVSVQAQEQELFGEPQTAGSSAAAGGASSSSGIVGSGQAAAAAGSVPALAQQETAAAAAAAGQLKDKDQ